MSAKYIKLADILRHQLPDFAAQGGKLPTEAQLSARYGMSRQTVRHALALLTDEGLIGRRQGSGSYVKKLTVSSAPPQVAVITSFLDDYIFPTILHDAQNVFAQQGCSTLVYTTENRVSTEREILTKLLSMDISAILVEGSKTALPSPNVDLYQKLRDKGVPILFLHGICSNMPSFPCILDNNRSGGYLLTKYLISKGHSCFAGLFKSDDLQGPQRYQGMMDALRDADLPLPDSSVCWYDTEQRRRIVDNQELSFLIDAVKHRFGPATAVVCYNDEIAHHLIHCLLQSGKRVPEDMAVVSFDNSYYSQIGPVPISSLGHRSSRTGRLAAQMLLRLMEGEAASDISLEWELVERASS